MAEPLTVSIADLRSGLDRVLRLVQELLGEEILVPVDHYWHLPVEAAFEMAQEPNKLTVGQVSDDLEYLRDPHDRAPQETWHDLAHMVGVLRALELAARS